MPKTKKGKRSAKSEPVAIGIIGGSGLYHMAGLTETRETRVKTPFGDPSDAIVIGTLEGRRVAFATGAATGSLPARSITAPTSAPSRCSASSASFP